MPTPKPPRCSSTSPHLDHVWWDGAGRHYCPGLTEEPADLLEQMKALADTYTTVTGRPAFLDLLAHDYGADVPQMVLDDHRLDDREWYAWLDATEEELRTNGYLPEVPVEEDEDDEADVTPPRYVWNTDSMPEHDVVVRTLRSDGIERDEFRSADGLWWGIGAVSSRTTVPMLWRTLDMEGDD